MEISTKYNHNSIMGMMIQYVKNLASFADSNGKKHVIILSSLDFGRWKSIDMSRLCFTDYLVTIIHCAQILWSQKLQGSVKWKTYSCGVLCRLVRSMQRTRSSRIQSGTTVQAIDFEPFGGAHTLYKSRSAARLEMGDVSGALEDTKEALTLAPHFPQLAVISTLVPKKNDNFDNGTKHLATAQSNLKNASRGEVRDNTKCKLLHWCVDGIVAEGRIASTDPNAKVHHVMLGGSCWKVWIDRVFVEKVDLIRPNDEMRFLEDAIGSTIAWLSKFIVHNLAPLYYLVEGIMVCLILFSGYTGEKLYFKTFNTYP